MSKVGWSTTQSKKGRKKKVAAIERKTNNPEIDKKKKKSPKKRKNNKYLNDNNQNEYNDNYYKNNKNNNEYRDNDYVNNNNYNYNYNKLTSKQYKISQQILKFIKEFWPNYKVDNILPKVITQLNLEYFDPKDEKLKIQILDCIVSELQDSISGKNKKKNKQNKQKK
eukprot:328709_1